MDFSKGKWEKKNNRNFTLSNNVGGHWRIDMFMRCTWMHHQAVPVCGTLWHRQQKTEAAPVNDTETQQRLSASFFILWLLWHKPTTGADSPLRCDAACTGEKKKQPAFGKSYCLHLLHAQFCAALFIPEQSAFVSFELWNLTLVILVVLLANSAKFMEFLF